jgi:hypothetical protein
VCDDFLEKLQELFLALKKEERDIRRKVAPGIARVIRVHPALDKIKVIIAIEILCDNYLCRVVVELDKSLLVPLSVSYVIWWPAFHPAGQSRPE